MLKIKIYTKTQTEHIKKKRNDLSAKSTHGMRVVQKNHLLM